MCNFSQDISDEFYNCFHKISQIDFMIVQITMKNQLQLHSVNGEQHWVTGFHCVCMCSVVGWLTVYQDGNYLCPGQYSQDNLLIADQMISP